MADHRKSRFLKKGEQERLLKMKEASSPQGIAIDPIPVTEGEEMTLLYSGLLSESGADQVYLHCGYGDAWSWHNVKDIRMEKTARGWVKTMQLEEDSRFNFCFKDSANNWDNNNHLNWSVEIHTGQQI